MFLLGRPAKLCRSRAARGESGDQRTEDQGIQLYSCVGPRSFNHIHVHTTAPATPPLPPPLHPATHRHAAAPATQIAVPAPTAPTPLSSFRYFW